MMPLSRRTFLLGVIVGITLSTFANQAPRYPTGIALNSRGELVVSEKGLKRVAVYSSDGRQLIRSYAMDEEPTGVAVEGNSLYVTTFKTKGMLKVLNLTEGKEVASVVVGSGAHVPIINKVLGKLYVCNQFQNTISEVDLSKNKVTRTVSVPREPTSAIISKDGKFLFVTNFLPAQRADVDYVAACVSVIDLHSFTKIKDIQLANGSNALRGICLTPDGKYAYVSHNLGRFTVPTSQLQQGWMNTSAFSVIDAKQLEFLGTVIVDEPERGAAGIWGIACNEEKIFMAHSGTHEISVIRHKEMLDKFLAFPDKSLLEYDLTFLYGLRERIPLQGNGPRGILLTGDRLIVPTYFSDTLNVMDTRTHALSQVDMNPGRVESPIDKGEKYFHDATLCFQHWQSCIGCHPEARADGMNWDLMNDGIGNPKNCKSLIFSHVTPPNMISGIRDSAAKAVRAGYKFIQFHEIPEEDAQCVDEYLISLQPVPSPYLVNNKLSKKAKNGKKVFERLKCGECHSGIYYTDMKMYRIGEDVEFEKGWDTPTLREVWRTAPYLFDGRAATMREVFEVHRHGINEKVSQKDIEALTEYVNSL
ncbi:MAG: YVTN family beta-propeller repeat-containing protein [Fermentimonas sp.]|jgi:YVTN family beta-propeller protein